MSYRTKQAQETRRLREINAKLLAELKNIADAMADFPEMTLATQRIRAVIAEAEGK